MAERLTSHPAQGDFWHSFFTEARPLMAGPPRPASADADLAALFNGAALRSNAQHDPLFACFTLRFSGTEHKVSTCQAAQRT